MKEKTENDPFFILSPVIKEYLWGGDRLASEYGFESVSGTAAEAWLLCLREKEKNTVENGEFRGKETKEVLSPDFTGRDYEKFPLLIKLIDAGDRLSVQVHPGKDGGGEEKNELWYVADCTDDAEIIFGISDGDAFRDAFSHNGPDIEKAEKSFRRIKVKKGDVYKIKAGTVHAVGGGIFICEIQQNSDTTYRLYDYGRKDRNGKTRELHIREALECIRFDAAPDAESAFSTAGKKRAVFGFDGLFECELIRLENEKSEEHLFDVFSHIAVISGEALLECGGYTAELRQGASVLAGAGRPFSLSGNAEIIVTRPLI